MSPGMRDAVRYARYLYDSVERWLTPPVLEIGSGFGTYTEMLLGHGSVIAADVDPVCLADLRQRMAGRDLRTLELDLNDHASIRAAGRLGFRSAFSTNVFEHIRDDVGALAALRDATPPGGHVCLVVPAHESLYGYMDEQAGHFRRYTRRSLGAALRRAGWQVRSSFYINAVGGLGWWVNQRLLPVRPLDAPRINGQLVFYDRFLVPVARLTDVFFRRFFGLSVVAIGVNGPT
jgi:SAM-dependent methyltransferase